MASFSWEFFLGINYFLLSLKGKGLNLVLYIGNTSSSSSSSLLHTLNANGFVPLLGKCKPNQPRRQRRISRDWKPCTASTRSSSPARMERGNVILNQVCSLKKSAYSRCRRLEARPQDVWRVIVVDVRFSRLPRRFRSA